MQAIEDYLMNNDAKIVIHSWVLNGGVEYEATLMKTQYVLGRQDDVICKAYSLVSFEDVLYQLSISLTNVSK